MKGRLEDLSLADILHIVYLSKRTGMLILDTHKGKASVIFKSGRIVNVLGNDPLPPLGEILVHNKVLKNEDLNRALVSTGDTPLGVYLIENGFVTEHDVQGGVRQQIILAIQALLKCREGSFTFELTENLPLDGISQKEISLENGLEPDDALDSSGAGGLSLSMPFNVSDSLGASSDAPLPEHYAIASALDDVISPSTDASDDFDIHIPQIQETEAQLPEFPAPPPPPVPTLTATPIEGQPTVVLVDDEALFRKHLEKRLKSVGYNVTALDSSGEALNLCNSMLDRKENFVVITDLLILAPSGEGFLGGLDVLSSIRKRSESMPVIIMTDHMDAKARHRAYELGVNNYLIKPDISHSDLDHLSEVVDQFADEINFIVKRMIKDMAYQQAKADSGSLEKPPPESAPTPSVSEQTFAQAASESADQIHAIRTLVNELQNPGETSEISLLILRLAAEFFDRAILFLVKKDTVFGLGGFGETGDKENINDKVQRIHIERHADCVFKKVIDTRQTHAGKLKDTPANRLLIEGLGKLVPRSVAVIPLVSRRRVIALLYGDNAGKKKPMGNIEGLEIFMSQAGIAMENALLQRKLKQFETQH